MNSEAAVPDRPAANMRRAAVHAALALVMLTLALYAVCGTFWDKKGLFFAGLRSQREYQRRLAHYQGVPLEASGLVHRVTVEPDGRAAFEWEMQFPAPAGGRARATDQSDPPRRLVVYRDAQGRPLPTRVTRTARQDDYLIMLPPAIHEGDLIKTVNSNAAARVDWLRWERDHWVYTYRHLFGSATVRYTHVLSLPPGAQVLDTYPGPTAVRRQGGRLVLVFDRQLGPMEAFRCKVAYRPAGGEEAGSADAR